MRVKVREREREREEKDVFVGQLNESEFRCINASERERERVRE